MKVIVSNNNNLDAIWNVVLFIIVVVIVLVSIVIVTIIYNYCNYDTNNKNGSRDEK